MRRVNYWFFIVEGTALTTASCVLLYSIFKSPNREKDKVYIIIVVLMLLYGIVETPLNAVFLINEVQP